MIRIFGCQGSIQLVAAAVAGQACRPGKGEGVRDYLVLHDLSVPGGQHEDFARVLSRMAPMAGTWERVVYLPPEATEQLRQQAHVGGRRALLAGLKERLGTTRADELYLTQNRIPTNRLLLNAFSGARKICYGDGIGVNFSYDYFHRPAEPPPATPPEPAPPAGRLRRLARRGRAALGRLRRGAPAGDWTADVPFDLHCLLLPNLFDEAVDRYVLTDREAYVSLFARFGSLLEGEAARACAEMAEALDAASEAVVVLTSNFTEAARMDRENELAGYLEVIAGLEADRGAALVIKPHPRDGVDKITQLRERLAQSYRRVVVLDDPLLFYLTFEVILAKHFLPRLSRRPPMPTRVVCFSSACLALEYLYGVPCTIGFGEELVRRRFFPEYVDLRLRHEADLRRAVQAIRAGEVGGREG